MKHFSDPATNTNTMLRDYQQIAVDDAVEWFATAGYGAKKLYTAPTGTGKSYIQLELLRRFPDLYLVTPSVEIIAGLLQKMGLPEGTDAEEHRVFTPIRLRNLLAAGTVQQPGKLCVDEAHHAEAETYKLLEAYVGGVPAVGYTATGFRGTPKGTAALRATWGEPVPIITFAEAANAGYLSVPTCRIEPLIDDDVIEVVNGEFVVSRIGEHVMGHVGRVVDLSADWVRPEGTGVRWDRPTMYAVPTKEAAWRLAVALSGAGYPALTVTAETNKKFRQENFRAVVERKAALVQIAVVSEGVDLPIRRLVDLRPTLSPVFWMQQVGRIERPVSEGEPPPEYVCCCRNLLRHAYLMEGMIPAGAIKESEEAFGGPGNRMGVRSLGFEGLGRFKAVELPLADGTTGLMYSLMSMQHDRRVDYVVLSSPAKSEVLYATRSIPRVNGMVQYHDARNHPWKPIAGLPDMTGFASLPPGPLTPAQRAFWVKSAHHRGLDPDPDKVNNKNFQALPVLLYLRKKLL
jgi:hypothetical protein